MNYGLKILALIIGLVVMNFSTFVHFYLFGNWSTKSKKIALVIGNIFVFIAWFSVMISSEG